MFLSPRLFNNLKIGIISFFSVEIPTAKAQASSKPRFFLVFKKYLTESKSKMCHQIWLGNSWSKSELDVSLGTA